MQPRSRALALPAIVVGLASLLAACGESIPSEAAAKSPRGAEPSGEGPGRDGDGTGSAQCGAVAACNGASSPDVSGRSFLHMSSTLIVAAGSPNHRGRDQIVPVGAAQWVIGKIAYGSADKDLEDEEVDVFVERGCAGSWEKLGTARTTEEGRTTHATVEGVPDTGGRVYFEIPKDKALPVGRHRVRLVVAGDRSTTDLLLEVVPEGAKIFVSDVDGTLTSSEGAEVPALLQGATPEVQPRAAEVLRALAARGYRPVYLTARPEWLTARTQEFLASHGFPPGIVHTTTTVTGAMGDAAASYKSAELDMLVAKKLTIAWAFGNKPSDTVAYEKARIEPRDQRVFLQTDDPNGGRRIESYADVLPAAEAAPSLCR